MMSDDASYDFSSARTEEDVVMAIPINLNLSFGYEISLTSDS
jgi:hypothetical protein